MDGHHHRGVGVGLGDRRGIGDHGAIPDCFRKNRASCIW